MRQISTKGIVLSKTNFAESDRIVTFLTPGHGKVKVLAKGIRKNSSRLSGSIELFSIIDLNFIFGKGKIATLTSARIYEHYSNIVFDSERTNTGYEFLITLNKSTEESTDSSYFALLRQGLVALNDVNLDVDVVRLWYQMHLIKLLGHQPNLQSDVSGHSLEQSASYSFDLERMRFSALDSEQGEFNAKQIKFLRLGFMAAKPEILAKVEEAKNLILTTTPLIQTILNQYMKA